MAKKDDKPLEPLSNDCTILEAARRYAGFGWLPIPVDAPRRVRREEGYGFQGGKKPHPDWESFGSVTEGLEACCAQSDGNLGVVLGESSGWLVDVDIDCQEALALADMFLPQTGAVFGRSSTPRAHRLYIAKNARTRKFSDPNPQRLSLAAKGSIIEIRSSSVGGKGKHQTVFPPSTHETQERIEWNSFHAPSEVDAAYLLERVQTLAAVVLIARSYPNEGSRHEFSLYLGGALIHGGMEPVRVADIIRAVAQFKGDEEIEDRIRTVESTLEKVRSGQPFGGFGKLEKLGFMDSKTAGKVRHWLGLSGGFEVEFSNNRVTFNPGGVASTLGLVTEVILEKNLPIFEFGDQGGVILEPIVEPLEDRGVRREGGMLTQALTFHHLRDALTKDGIRWQKLDKRSGKLAHVPPPKEDLQTFCKTLPSSRALPILKGVSYGPTIRPRDFTLVESPGYDKTSGIFVSWDGEMPKLAQPSDEKIRDSIALIRELFSEVAFKDRELGLTTILASIQAVLAKLAIGPAPMTLTNAHTAGTGKSYLAELCGLVAMGHEPASMTMGWNEDELQKRLDSSLLAGETLLNIDNIDRKLKSSTLCTVITGTSVSSRVLGKSENKTVPANLSVFANGNNLDLDYDLTRRAVTIELDANCERPEKRQFHLDPKALVRANRFAYVEAALMPILAYMKAGMPDQGLDPLGFGGGYTKLVRSSLVFCGLPDPGSSIALSTSRDTQTGMDVAIFRAGIQVFGEGNEFRAADLRSVLFDDAQLGNEAFDKDTADSITTLREGFDDCQNVSAIGKKLSGYDGKIFDGIRFKKRQGHRSTSVYVFENSQNQ